MGTKSNMEKKFTCRLKSGENVEVAVQTPPLEPEHGLDEKMFWWNDIRDRAFNGELGRGNLEVKFFSGEIEDAYVGSVVLLTSKTCRDVGLVEFVGTVPEHRGKGVAGAVLDAVIEWFEAEGGLALYLCTTNPVAYKLYKKKGFKRCIGDGLRRIAGGGDENFNQSYLAHKGPARIRTAEWGDMPYFAPLYNNPESDIFLKDFILSVFQDGRFESHFKKMMIPHEKGEGGLLVLENPKKRIVGACFLKEGGSFYEQHIGLIDYMIAPDYSAQGKELLTTMSDKAGEIGLEMLINRGAGCDMQKLAAFREAGFHREASVKSYYKTETDRHDMVMNVLKLESGGNRAFRKTRDHYYGYRGSS